MCLSITSLNSGSNGNCYYVGNDDDAVLIDAGISCKETEKRMHSLGLSMKKLRAVFISHEHSDHIRGLQVIAEKYSLPVYITSATMLSGGIKLNENLVATFSAYEPVQIGHLSITAFPKFHDASDPHSFIVSCHGVNVGVFTDIGAPCKHLVKHFALCHAAFLEANYDEAMLENGRYPYFLKNRIRDGHGHLSNLQALELFRKHRPKFMTHLLLAHLSKDNNCPELARKMFDDHAAGTNIIVASRYEASPVYFITGPAAKMKRPVIVQKLQLSLFE